MRRVDIMLFFVFGFAISFFLLFFMSFIASGDDDGFIILSIYLAIAIIISCTLWIVETIKNTNKN